MASLIYYLSETKEGLMALNHGAIELLGLEGTLNTIEFQPLEKHWTIAGIPIPPHF